jgi:hypothetical protein
MEFVEFLEKGVPLAVQQNSSRASDKISARSSLPFWESQTPLGPVSPRKHTEQEMSRTSGRSSNEEFIHSLI